MTPQNFVDFRPPVTRDRRIDWISTVLIRLVLLMVSYPLTTSPVEEVPGVAKRLRLLPIILYFAK